VAAAASVSWRTRVSSARAASRSRSARSARARSSPRDSSSTWARDSSAPRSSSRSRAAPARTRSSSAACAGGHLGQALGGVGEPGEDLVSFPPGAGPQLREFARGVFTDPRGLCACVLGAGLGGGGPLVSLRGLREGLVASVIGGAYEGPGPGLRDRLLRLRLGAACALLGRGDALGLVRLGPLDRAVPVFLGDGDARLGFLADPLELGGVRGGSLGQPVVSFAGPGLRGVQVLAHQLGRLVARPVSFGGALPGCLPRGIDLGLSGGRVT